MEQGYFVPEKRSECNLIHKVPFLFFPLGNKGRVGFCAVCVESLAWSSYLEWLQDEFRLGLQHSGGKRIQLTFGVSLPTSSQGERAGELPLERQQALPSEFPLQCPLKQWFFRRVACTHFLHCKETLCICKVKSKVWKEGNMLYPDNE